MSGYVINTIIKDFQYLFAHVNNKECREKMTFGLLASLLDSHSELSDEEIGKILRGLNRDTKGELKTSADHALSRLVSDAEESNKTSLPSNFWSREDFMRDVIDSL
jgi:hypothetical protein